MDFLNLLQWVAVTAIAIVVYLDAVSNKIGRVKGERSVINFPAGFWAIFTILLIIAAVPIYLFLRKRLVDRAKDHPVIVTPKQKKNSIILIAVIGLATGVAASIPSLWPSISY